jgi:putative membrane protein
VVAARRLIAFLLVLALVLLAAAFAYNNPEPVTIDTGFARFAGVSLALALVVALAIGWLAGLLTAGLGLWRITSDRRRLRRELKLAEAELRSLRSLPLNDAD